MKEPRPEPTSLVVSIGGTAIIFGAWLFHAASRVAIGRRDHEYVDYLHGVAHGEPLDPHYERLHLSWLVVMLLLIGSLPLIAAGPTWVIRHGPKLIWVLPLTWLAIYFLLFRPH